MFWEKKENEYNLEVRVAFLAILKGAIRSGGVEGEESNDIMRSALQRMKLFDDITDLEIDKIKQDITNLEEEHGYRKAINIAVENLSTEMNETVFAMVMDIILSDGVVEGTEEKFIEELEKNLNIKSSTARKIIEVMMIKNRG